MSDDFDDADPDRCPLGEMGRNVLPSSQFLHERLQERRTKNMRPKRARHTDFGVNNTALRGRDDDIFFTEAEESRSARRYDSSPVVTSARASDAGATTSDRRRRVPGVRDMDNQLDRLSKQNFALKLELDHRRAQAIKMQGQIDAMTEQVQRASLLEEEHKELLRINSQLVLELEKRDRAVEEAIDHICDLEEQVSVLQERDSHTRPSTAQADSGYAGTETHEQAPPSSPLATAIHAKMPNVNVHPPSTTEASAASQNLQGILHTQTPGKPKREPSILSSKKPSTNALRSVYLENTSSLHPVKSFHSLLSRQDNRTDEDGDDTPNSPRLSVLSESSFPSIYSPRETEKPDEYEWEAVQEDDNAYFASTNSRSHMRQDSIKRVSQWISERDTVDATPSKSNNIPTSLSAHNERHDDAPRFQSPAHTLTLAALDPEAADSGNDLHQSHPQLRKTKARGPQIRRTSLVGPMFGGSMYPPTPDSVSTRMLRDSRSTIAEDRTLLNTAPTDAEAVMAHELSIRTAPKQMRSSVELRGAYNSNLDFRQEALDGSNNDDSSDEEYVRPDIQTHLGTATIEDILTTRDLVYDDFPDGESIKLGTPSRFMSHAVPPSDIMFNHHDLSPTSDSRYTRRRKSSDQIMSNPLKPRLSRMETSPTITGSARMTSSAVNDGKASVESVLSPQSVHSGSSSNRTAIPPDDRSQRTLSPGAGQMDVSLARTSTSPSQARSALSPSRTLSKKMPSLFRRFSSSQGSDREVSPLPTLTSTPSSAYTNVPPRPKTSHTDRTPKTPAAATVGRAPTSRETPRPSLPLRLATAESGGRPASAAGTDRERRSLFRRSNSVKPANAKTASHAQSDLVPEPAARGAPAGRRGSIREVVASRRPWR